MNHEIDPQDQVSKTALTLQQHAMQEIDAVAEGIAALQERYTGVVYDVSTTAGMADAKAARKEIRQVRYDVERIRKDKGSELKRIATAINDRAAEITAPIRALEEPIDSQIKAEEERKAAEKAAEQERIAKQERALECLRRAPLECVGADAAALQDAIQKMHQDSIDWLDDVYRPEAEKIRAESVAALEKMLDERRKLDEAAAELERQRQEQAAREAAEAEARRKQQEKEDAERRAKQEAEDAERKARQEAEDRARAEAEAKLAKEREELEARERAQREAEAKAEQERLEAAQKAEADRVQREQEEAARREQERREAEERAIQAATIREAAQEVLVLLDENGLSGHIAARKLSAALSREAQS